MPLLSGQADDRSRREGGHRHEEPPRQRATADLGAAFDQLRSKSAEREERFKQQMQAEAQKGKVLDRKFQESLKKAKDSPDPPPRRYDYD